MKRMTTALAATALLTLAACGGSADKKSDGPWSYTDGRDKAITAKATPKRIVAQTSVAAGLADVGITSVGVFGPLKLADGSVDPQAAGLDPKKVTDVSTATYGALNLEKLASLKPDLLVTNMFVPPELWYVNSADEKKIDKLVPTLGVNFKDASLIQSIERVEKVAKALGANLDSGAVKADRQDFDEASDRLRALGKKLDGKKILAVSATPDLAYFGDPAQFPDLDYYTSLGLPIIKAKAPAGSYWEDLSWEKADKYKADIVLWDSRDAASLALLKKEPVFDTIPAARNGAYVAWQPLAPYSFKGYAKVMNDLADNLQGQL